MVPLLLFAFVVAQSPFLVSTSTPVETYQQIELSTGKVNEVYHLNVTNGTHRAVGYTLSSSDLDLKNGEIRLDIRLDPASFPNGLGLEDDCPLLVTISQGKQVTSFYLPHRPPRAGEAKSSASQIAYRSWGKTICIDKSRAEGGNARVTVVTSTCHSDIINFSMLLSYSPGALLLDLGQELETYVTPTRSQFFKYEFSSEEDTIIVKLRAPNDKCHDKNNEAKECKCMTVSVQPLSCPVNDDSSNVRHMGLWQMASSQAAITVEKSDEIFREGFYLVLVSEYEDSPCTNKGGYAAIPRGLSPAVSKYENSRHQKVSALKRIHSPTFEPREKQVFVSVQRVLSPSQYWWPTLFSLLIYGFVILLTIGTYIWFHRGIITSYRTSNVRPIVECCLRSEKYICDIHDDVDSYKREKLEKKSKRYLWLLITVAVFYSIPVFQLIINYLSIVYRTGEQDICYYNNLCSLPLKKIMDFNHIYSNVGYVIFGIAFFIFTFLRKRTMESRRGYFVFETKPMCCGLLERLPRKMEYGTFDQYGLFYSLGFALFMEGFLSASYHICPNRANFQFDTSFMYAMAVLSYVKIYQFRHFIYLNELMAFLLLAMVVACVVLGLFSTSVAYNIVLSFLHLVVVICFQFLLIFLSKSSDQPSKDPLHKQIWGTFLEICFIRRDREYLINHHPNVSLFWWTVFWNVMLVVNSWTLVYGKNFATQVLYILLANLAVYLIYYFIMKFIHGEFSGLLSSGIRNPLLQPLIYGGISLIFWIPGLYYFMSEMSNWEYSPAQSKEYNEACAMLSFYDNHDIWHLLSAPALFFSFMVFLTIDDGLIGRHHESIPVF